MNIDEVIEYLEKMADILLFIAAMLRKWTE